MAVAFGLLCLGVAGAALARRALLRHGGAAPLISHYQRDTFVAPLKPERGQQGPIDAELRQDERDLARALHNLHRTGYLRDLQRRRGAAASAVNQFENIRNTTEAEVTAEAEEAPETFTEKTRSTAGGGFEPQVTLDEAALILNISLADAADPKQLQSAHRRVMLRNHPDRGGSPYLATKINEAKETLATLTVDEAELKRREAAKRSADRSGREAKKKESKKGDMRDRAKATKERQAGGVLEEDLQDAWEDLRHTRQRRKDI